MTDRELLEFAAKAAGIDPISWIEPDGTKIVTNVRWNPLTDDGDAFRLAVKLNIDIRPSMSGGTKYRYAARGGNTYGEVNSDPYAATRRAIVRAAAEIGKQNNPT